MTHTTQTLMSIFSLKQDYTKVYTDRKFSVSLNYKHNLINYLYCEWMSYNRECVGRESERVLERDLLILHVNYSYINI